MDRIAPVLADRTSGFTRITEVGTRAGDSAKMVTLAWVNQPEKSGTLTGDKAGLIAVTSQEKKVAPKAAPEKKKTVKKTTAASKK